MNLGLYIVRNDDFLDSLPDLHQLGRAGPGVRLQTPTLAPLVCLIMVGDVAKQQAAFAAVYDQPHVLIDSRGEKAMVLRPLQLVELKAGMGRVHLQVEGGGLYKLLFLGREPGKAAGECIWFTRKIFITSSPRWLILTTAFITPSV